MGTHTPRPVLLFDGDCAFCTSCANVVARHLRPRATVLPYQECDLSAYGITPDAAATSIQFVDNTGRVFTAGAAVRAVLRHGSVGWQAVAGLLSLPGISWLLERGYELVARNRGRLPGGTPACQLAGRASSPRR